MPDQKLKQFEKNLKDKIEELDSLTGKKLKEALQYQLPNELVTLSLSYKEQANGCQIALDMLYETYPELKKLC